MSAIETQIAGTEANTYDKTPYESYPFSQTKVEHLKTLAYLFELKTPDLETARILELGCASGGNILPQAVRYPKAKFVGVDLSEVQTKAAREQIKSLGLKNIEIKTASITDIDESYGEFDYIICHGVISWVPENVRHAIFDVCSKLLSPTGVAYISYNTLPGWNMVRSIRDMMLYHSQGFTDTEDKLNQSLLLLQFIKDSLEGTQSPYGEILKTEADLLTSQNKSYLRHDHLEETNHQYYFHDFMKEADEKGLQYLADAVIATMYLGNLPKKMIQKLQEINNIIKLEQYMDFITNRRFRSTILCRKNIVLNRNIDAKKMMGLYLSTNLTPEKPIVQVDLGNNSEAVFFYNNSPTNKISTTSPITKALFYTFAENQKQYLSIDQLAKFVQKKLPKLQASLDDIKNDIATNMLRLVFSGYIMISTEKNIAADKLSKKPEISKYARLQLELNKGTWLTNQIHEKVNLNIFDNYALKYLDGNHTEEMILDKILEHAKNGQLTISKANNKITDTEEMKKELELYLAQSLTRYLNSNLLVR